MKYIVYFAVAVLASVVLFAVAGNVFYAAPQEEVADLQQQLEQEQQRNSQLEDELANIRRQLRDRNETIYELMQQKKEAEEKEGTPEGSTPTAYITIDDGPSENTIQLLDILKEHSAVATFFVTGNNSSGQADIYNRIVNEGHGIGNHTYSHVFETIYLSPQHFMEDFLEMEQFIFEQTGIQTDIMRFPGGSSSGMAPDVSGYNIIQKDLINKITAKGYDYFDWNVSSVDTDYSLSPQDLVDNVVAGVERLEGEDAVILFHDGPNNVATVQAMPQVIAKLRSMGYKLEVLSKGAADVKHREALRY